MTTKTNASTTRKSLRVVCAGLVATLGITGALAIGAPTKAYANDGYDQGYMAGYQAATQSASHYEGEPVTIFEGSDKPVYAEWHKGSSGNWWATFYTYNYTKVWAAPAPAGCGWTFHVYDANGNWTQVVRNEFESSAEGKYGPQGIASHWQELDGSRWF